MFKTKTTGLWIHTLIIAVFMMIFTLNLKAENLDVFPEIKGTLAGMDQQERETLAKLFGHVQQIEGMEKEAQTITAEILGIRSAKNRLQSVIEDEERAYFQQKQKLKELLLSYQRLGPGSYLEILFTAKDLPDFLRRVNTLRDMTRNSAELIDQLQSSQEKLAFKKSQLDEQLALMEDKQVDLTYALTQANALKRLLESDLASFSLEKVEYSKHLEKLEQRWQEVKPLFATTAAQLSRNLEEGSLPIEVLKLTTGSKGVKGSIEEAKLNEILAGYPRLPKIVLRLRANQVELSVPAFELSLKGTFQIEKGRRLIFQAQEGTFSGMPLQQTALAQLFERGQLQLDFKTLLGIFTLSSVEIKEGLLEVTFGL